MTERHTELYTDPKKIPFQQIELIGHGTVGVVDQVEGTGGVFKGHTYARKTIILSDKPEDRQDELEEIEREVEILRNVRHKHVVQLIATYLLQTKLKKYAIIMDPHADGGNLEAFLTNPETRGEAAQHQILGWLSCLINTVAYIHGKGIRHRDIKPTNILIHNDSILITDFGISMMGLGITVPTTMIGRPRSRTREYCSPEVQNGSTRGRAADIFSLGAVCLEMLAAQAGLGEIDTLRKSLEFQGSQSYAQRVDQAFEFMDSFAGRIENGSWQSAFLILCREMLHKQRDVRPKADEVRKRWSHQARPEIPQTCNCTRNPREINEELRYAHSKEYQRAASMLTDKIADISDDYALVAT